MLVPEVVQGDVRSRSGRAAGGDRRGDRQASRTLPTAADLVPSGRHEAPRGGRAAGLPGRHRREPVVARPRPASSTPGPARPGASRRCVLRDCSSPPRPEPAWPSLVASTTQAAFKHCHGRGREALDLARLAAHSLRAQSLSSAWAGIGHPLPHDLRGGIARGDGRRSSAWDPGQRDRSAVIEGLSLNRP